MSISRWDPWGEIIGLREAMDTLLEQSFVRPRTEGTTGAFGLAVDVEDRGDAFVVETAVPGVKPEDVEISVIGDVLRIHAERREERKEGDQEGGRRLVREQRYGVFERVLRLPTAVEAGQAQAEFRDGVLRITLPKSEASKERRIPVRAGNGQADQPQSMEAQTGQSQQGRQGAEAQQSGQSQESRQGAEAQAGQRRQSAQAAQPQSG